MLASGEEVANYAQSRAFLLLEGEVSEDWVEQKTFTKLRASFEFDAVLRPLEDPWPELREKRSASSSMEGGCRERDMVVEVAADLIVGIANAFGVDTSGGKQQARGFDRAGSEDDVLSFEAERSSGKCADKDSFNAVARRGKEKLGDLGVEIDLCARVP